MYPWISGISTSDLKTLYPILCTIAYLHHSIISKLDIGEELRLMFAANQFIQSAAMGFPGNWKNEPLWQRNPLKVLR